MIMKCLTTNMVQTALMAFAINATSDFPFSGFVYRKQHYIIIGTADDIRREWLFEFRALWHNHQVGGAVFMPQRYGVRRVSYKQFRALCHEWGFCDCTDACGIGDIAYPAELEGGVRGED